ncbi:MAG: hypothetical protein DSZ06_01900, partial [Sulfurospirillum sp.]
CFDKIYRDYYSDDNSSFCSSSCVNSSGSSCYDCLKKYYATPICSRDNFAIRPESYSIQVLDGNETDSNTTTFIARNNSASSANLAAGYLYKLDINATKFNSTTEKAEGYFLNVVGDETKKKAIAKFNDSSTCDDTNNHELNIHILNGSTSGYESLTQNQNTPLNGLIINNSGKYKIHLEDKEWTKVDQQNYPYKPFPNIADCITASSELGSGLNAKRGCDITSEYNSQYYDLNVNIHPYSFDLSSIGVEVNPNSSSDYMYINDLNKTTSLIQNGKAMALTVKGKIIAKGKNGATLSNYTNQCSAKDLNVTLNYKTLQDNNITDIKDELGNIITPEYALYVNPIDSTVNVKSATPNKIIVNFASKYFDDNSPNKGEADFTLYFNYKRNYNTAINPFSINFDNFDVNSTLDSSVASLDTNHIPKVSKDLNTTKKVYYAKARSKSDFYDDIYDDSIVTPMMVTVFCNKSLDYCEKYNIETNTSLTSEYDWWVFKYHNAVAGEGNITIETDDINKATVAPGVVNSFTDGVNENVKVTAAAGINRPFTVCIKPTVDMITNYSYLLFNKDKNTPPDCLDKTRFVDTKDAWSGKGATGRSINVNSSGRKSKKVEW